MTKKIIDRVDGKNVQCLIQRAGDNYRVFEINRELVRFSLVTPNRQLEASRNYEGIL